VMGELLGWLVSLVLLAYDELAALWWLCHA
jgi:hypothetical protein